jgi:cytochrome c-type biogenesis protein
MNLFLPVVLGLIGFLQPCTMGVNWAFAGHGRGLGKKGRVTESLKLILVRAAFYGSLGAVAGYLGGLTPGPGEKNLAFIFLAFSMIFLISKFKALPVPNIDLVKTSYLPIRQGLMIPSCLLPLTIALLLLSALSRSPVQGLLYLSFFGASLTLPLLLACILDLQGVLRKLSRLIPLAPVLASMSLAATAGLIYTG